MLYHNKNKIFVGLVLILALSCLSFLPDAKEQQPVKWENLKVLPKNITHDELIDVMKGFNLSLGVKCNYCHVKNDSTWNFAADDLKEKSIARKMFTMTKAINKKYFGISSKQLYGTVTCMTCHQGGTEPKGKLN